MLKKIIRLGGILCIIGLITTLLLAAANYVTKDIIAENTENNVIKSRQELVNAEKFEQIGEGVYEGKKGDETLGYCVDVTQKGFGGDIKMIVGFDINSAVTGIKIIESSESPGLGAKASKEDFAKKQNLIGKKAPVSVKKGKGSGENEFDAISSATITSEAIASGINSAYERVLEATGESEAKND